MFLASRYKGAFNYYISELRGGVGCSPEKLTFVYLNRGEGGLKCLLAYLIKFNSTFKGLKMFFNRSLSVFTKECPENQWGFCSFLLVLLLSILITLIWKSQAVSFILNNLQNQYWYNITPNINQCQKALTFVFT